MNLTEPDSEGEENSYEDLIITGSAPKKNKYETAEVEFIQQEIQLVTKKIEHEKIKLRIANERYDQKKKEYNILQGKPVEKNVEEKEKEHKARLEENKNHKLETTAKPKKVNKTEEFKLMEKKQNIKISKQENALESLTKHLNETNLKIDELQFEISNLRKRKLASKNQIKSLNDKNQELEEQRNNQKALNQKENDHIEIDDKNELAEREERGFKMDKDFKSARNVLEGEYHKIIEANIQRERERKKEQAKKRNLLGAIARKAMKANQEPNIEKEIKKIRDEEICDRIPILDQVLEKWKKIIKTKKNCLEKYIQNSKIVKQTFDIIMKFLCVDNYDELPIIYGKTEEQTASIESYKTDLINEKDRKAEEKQNLIEKIQKLENKIAEFSSNKVNFNQEKINNIQKLEEKINNLKNDIELKRDFFRKLQPLTDKFLRKLNSTYIADYVPNKVPLDDLKYNEGNITIIFDNVANYYKLITEAEKSLRNNAAKDEEVNRRLDLLRTEINTKLENFKFDSIITPQSIKRDLKASQNDFEGTMKSLAETIIGSINKTRDLRETREKDYA